MTISIWELTNLVPYILRISKQCYDNRAW